MLRTSVWRKMRAEADGAYKVDDNGNIDLTVEDKNHPDKRKP